MLYLFNDVIFEIGQPEDIIRSGVFPMSAADFSRLQAHEIIQLAREEVFSDLHLPHNEPEAAKHLAVLLATKTRSNAVLIGPPIEGARVPEDLGFRLAEVSMFTISHLFQLQEGGTLQPAHVYEAVWQNLEG